jgi:DNA-binding NarL/FixJ family response regulator
MAALANNLIDATTPVTNVPQAGFIPTRYNPALRAQQPAVQHQDTPQDTVTISLAARAQQAAQAVPTQAQNATAAPAPAATASQAPAAATAPPVALIQGAAQAQPAQPRPVPAQAAQAAPAQAPSAQAPTAAAPATTAQPAATAQPPAPAAVGQAQTGNQAATAAPAQPTYSQVLTLSLEGLSIQEIALQLGITPQAVQSYLG